MGRFNYLQSNFLLGEVSPKMYGRSDLKEFYQMAQTIQNGLVFRQGGVTRRPGSQFQISGLYSTVDNTTYALGTDVRLIPFTFSDTEQYMMILYTYGSSPNNTNIDTNELGIAMYNIQTGDTCVDVGSGTNPGIFDNRDPDFTPETYTIFTTLAQIQSTQFSQSGDVICLTGHGLLPFFVIRTATNVFEIIDCMSYRTIYDPGSRDTIGGTPPIAPTRYAWEAMPYMTVPGKTFVGQTITLAATTGSTVAITWTGGGGVSPVPDGSMIRVDGSATTGFGIVRSSGTEMQVLQAWPDTSAYVYTTGAWNSSWGFPKCVANFQQRFVYANTTQFPDSIWGSQQGDITLMMANRMVQDPDYSDAITNDRPFGVYLSEDKINQIQWLSPSDDLFVGTQSGEWLGVGTDGNTSLGPLNIGFSLQTTYGSQPIQAVRSDGAVHFVQRGGQLIREVVFDFRENHRLAYDMNYFSEHMPKKGVAERAAFQPGQIIQMAYGALPHNITWCLDNNGFVFGLTRDRLAVVEVKAWHWHALGGVINTDEYPFVSSIACSPSVNGDFDELWMSVNRTINGSTVTTIEKMGKPYELPDVTNSSTDPQDKMFLADCAKFVRLGSPGTTWTGFDHLDGCLVDVVCDGNYIGQFTVSGGTISIGGSTNYTECIAGLPYTAIIQPMPATQGSVMGTGDSTPKRIDRAIFRYFNSTYFQFGKTNDSSLMSVALRDPSVPNGTPTPFYTGTKIVPYKGPMEDDADIMVVSQTAQPFTLTSLTLRGTTYEG